MNTNIVSSNILDIAVALSDRDLLARIPVLAAHERAAELVAHLAALRLRPSLYAAQGYGSLFAYCRHALRLSEDAASNRIHAARGLPEVPGSSLTAWPQASSASAPFECCVPI